MKTRFIFNPKSGRQNKNIGVLPMLRAFVSARSTEADICVTEGPGHATEIAREAVAAGFQRVVAVGGDGTVNEVAQALIYTPVAMGLVPCGSGNGLALHLSLPMNPRDAIKVAGAEDSQVGEMDTATANGLIFVNAMGLGLDAEVAQRFNLLTRRGLPAYASTALSAFFSRKSMTCHVVSGSHRETIEALLISVANSDQYGNNAKIAPHARIDDGLLDLVAVRPVGLLGASILGARLFIGNVDRSPRVRHLRSSRFLIERPNAGIIHTDGETHMAGACVEVCVQARSLKVVVPALCPALSRNNERSNAGFALQLP